MRQRFYWVALMAVYLAASGGVLEAGSPDEVYLEFDSLLLDDAGGTEGLNGANSAVVSPDGRFVYLASFQDNSLIQYQRDPASGLVTQENIRRAGLGEDGSLDGIFALQFGPGADHLYALTSNGRLLLFERDALSGNLSLTQNIQNEGARVRGLRSPRDLAVPADGRHVYVAAGNSGTLAIFERDPSDGQLTFRSLLDGAIEVPGREDPVNVFDLPSRITASADSRFLYLVSFRGGVTTFERNLQTGALQALQNLGRVDNVGFPWEIALSPEGEHAYVVDLSGGFPNDPQIPPGIRIFQRDSQTGLLSRVGDCCTEVSDPALVESGVSFQFHPNGEQVYVIGFHESRVSRFNRDTSTGLLEWAEEISEFSSGAPKLLGASRMGMDPGGNTLYVPSNEDDSLTVIALAAPNGPMAVVQQWIDGEGALVDGLDRPKDLAVSTDGRFVYSTSFWDDSLSVQQVSPDGRSLDQVQLLDVSGPEAFGSLGWMALSPDSRHLYLRRNGISLYSRDESSGFLSFEEVTGETGFHHSIGISPLGDRVYVGARESSGPGLRSYARDASTGTLTQVDTFVEYDRGNSSPGIFDPIDQVLVSPDGRHIYVINRRHLLVVFARPEEGERLDFVQEIPFNAVPRVFGISTPASFAFDSSGQHLYVIASRGGVIVFQRDSASGRLTYVEHYEDEPEERFPSFEPSTVSVSPDGFHVYVTDAWEDSLNVFVRNPINGRLKLLEKRRNGVGGVDGLLDPEAFALSADGERVFVGTEVGGILSFTKRDLVCEPGEEKLCLNQGRFHVEMDWLTQRGNMGPGKSVPVGSDDSGLFWFFNPNNWEMLVKVLDGCGVDESFWVFSAATTNVEYTMKVTDSLTGLQQTFFNPLGAAAPAIAATGLFPACPLGEPAGESGQPGSSQAATQSSPPQLANASAAGSTCADSDSALCLFEDRFRVEVDWQTRDGRTGQGRAVPAGSDNSGLLWFFNDQNWEMLVKVINGCESNDHFWVFSAATTNVEYTLRVTDTETGEVKEYFNPLNSNARAITDTEAFGSC